MFQLVSDTDARDCIIKCPPPSPVLNLLVHHYKLHVHVCYKKYMFSTKRLKHLCPVPLGLLSSLSRSLEPRKQFSSAS